MLKGWPEIFGEPLLDLGEQKIAEEKSL